MSDWTKAVCLPCWPAWCLAQGKVPHEPTRVRDADEDHCVACGNPTTAGVYVRVDPEITGPWLRVNPPRTEGD